MCVPSSSHTAKSWSMLKTSRRKTNYREKEKCPLEGKFRSEDIYKCVVTATGHPRKAYLGTAEGDFKQRYCNHKKSFRNQKY